MLWLKHIIVHFRSTIIIILAKVNLKPTIQTKFIITKTKNSQNRYLRVKLAKLLSKYYGHG